MPAPCYKKCHSEHQTLFRILGRDLGIKLDTLYASGLEMRPLYRNRQKGTVIVAGMCSYSWPSVSSVHFECVYAHAGEVSDIELDILSTRMLELCQSGKYTFRQLASSVLKLPPATILNVRIDASSGTSTEFFKIFHLFYAWREDSVNNTRLKLAKILMDENLDEVLDQCLLKDEQTTEDLFPNVPLENIKQEMTDCGAPGRWLQLQWILS